jgi:hypothetical protein
MGTTALGFPYPEPSDPIAQGADAIKALAESLNARATRLKTGYVSSGPTGPTSGTTRLVICTASVPDYGAGSLFAMAQCYWTKTVGGDRFDLDINCGAPTFKNREGTTADTVRNNVLFGWFLISGGAQNVTMGLTRISGTGTATVTFAGFSSLIWLFVPT